MSTKSIVSIYLLLMISTLSVLAQNEQPLTDGLEVIAASNLNRLEQLEMFRRGTIEEMAWSPDESLLAVGGSAGGWIYQVDDLQTEPIHFAQFMRVSDLDFSPAGDRIISTGDAGAVHEWDATTGRLIRTIRPERYNEGPYLLSNVVTVEYSLNGEYIATGASNDPLLLLNAHTGVTLQTILQSVMELSFSPDGQYLAATQYGSNEILIWNIETLLSSSELSADYTVHMPYTVWNVAWTADSTQILAASFDEQQLSSFNLKTQEITPIAESGFVVAVNIDYIATRRVERQNYGTYSVYLDLLNRNTSNRIASIEGLEDMTDIRFSPSGQFLAVGQADGSFNIFDATTLEQVNSVAGSGSMIFSIALLDDNYLLGLDSQTYDTSTLYDGGGCGVEFLSL